MTTPSEEYERLIRPIEPQMLRSIWRIVQNADDADDAMQEATATIWKRIDKVRRHGNPQALVLRICIQQARDVVRRRARRIRLEKELNRGETPGAGGDDPSANLEMQQTRNEIGRAIANLSEQQATVVSMRYLLGCSDREVVDALGCAESTVRVHAQRGLERLRSLLSHLRPKPAQESR